MPTQVHGTGRPGEHLTGDIEYFTAYTLVDCTDSGVTDPNSSDTTGYNQSQNLNVLLQLTGLRAQPIVSSVLKRENQDLADYSFGSGLTGTHTIWIVKFATEYKGAWARAGDNTYHLVQDCDGVAVTTGLDDTATLVASTFNTTDAVNMNLYFVRNDNL
jgi:hypothetical protein